MAQCFCVEAIQNILKNTIEGNEYKSVEYLIKEF